MRVSPCAMTPSSSFVTPTRRNAELLTFASFTRLRPIVAFPGLGRLESAPRESA